MSKFRVHFLARHAIEICLLVVVVVVQAQKLSPTVVDPTILSPKRPFVLIVKVCRGMVCGKASSHVRE